MKTEKLNNFEEDILDVFRDHRDIPPITVKVDKYYITIKNIFILI